MNQKIVAICGVIIIVNLVGCDDGSDDLSDCTAVAEGLAVCVDDFCNGEGDGTQACECWWSGGDMETPACTCETADPVAAFRQACEDNTWPSIDCSYVVPAIRQTAESCQ